jgi:hypothetical protein
MCKLFILFLGLLSFSAFAETATLNRESDAANAFCENRTKDSTALQNLIQKNDNQLYFTNQGGFFGGGVCWWHSRFTRSAAYLAVFDPTLPKPTDEEAKKIIQRLRSRKGMTLIPGFKNLREFSLSYRDQIQDKLNDWQRTDGVLKASWIKGLSGKSNVETEKLEQGMDELYERVQKGEVVYQMLQMPGIVAHAWLVVGMEKTADGYKLTVIDSNTGTDTFTFRTGMTTFPYHGWYKFVPYTGQVKEEKKLMNKMSKFCNGEETQEDNSNEETEEDSRTQS